MTEQIRQEQIQANEPQYSAKILNGDKVSHTLASYTKLNMIDIAKAEELAKVFDPIYDGELIDYFPTSMSDRCFWFSEYDSTATQLGFILRWEYIYNAGYAIITKVFADALSTFLKGKKCLEIMSGRGLLSKALRDRGVDVIPTDDKSWKQVKHDDTFVEVEDLKAWDAIRKYNDVDYIICSWMPMEADSESIINAIKESNPNVRFIFIGEDEGGCTGNEYFFDNVEEIGDDNFEPVQSSFLSWHGIHDRPMLLEIK